MSVEQRANKTLPAVEQTTGLRFQNPDSGGGFRWSATGQRRKKRREGLEHFPETNFSSKQVSIRVSGGKANGVGDDRAAAGADARRVGDLRGAPGYDPGCNGGDGKRIEHANFP